jgi:hypothetical protein
MGFLERKEAGQFQGEIMTDLVGVGRLRGPGVPRPRPSRAFSVSHGTTARRGGRAPRWMVGDIVRGL